MFVRAHFFANQPGNLKRTAIAPNQLRKYDFRFQTIKKQPSYLSCKRFSQDDPYHSIP